MYVVYYRCSELVGNTFTKKSLIINQKLLVIKDIGGVLIMMDLYLDLSKIDTILT